MTIGSVAGLRYAGKGVKLSKGKIGHAKIGEISGAKPINGKAAKGVDQVDFGKCGINPVFGRKTTSSNNNIHKLYSPVLESKRVGSAIQIDNIKSTKIMDFNGKVNSEKEFPYAPKEHGFPNIIDNYPTIKDEFPLVGGDGKKLRFFQIEDHYNGKKGVFEWIIDFHGNMTHRRFITNGILTGKPNQIIKK
ncbi:hypothetical protein XA3_17040 [Xylocopilactobacillus apicola]|uniref:Uncharacterized protein n=2 Tax=Xylocopilactobacillus apicola TaxID=2932184 RepID=A0AAU9D6T8_9LACO|nr:hypothetical protein XA3_17040 [Xylocopilactobacillus apicola]